MRIVLDTNVLLTALLNPRGTPATILNAILDEQFVLLVDDRILSEYHDVLQRRKFGFPKETVTTLLNFLRHCGDYVVAGPTAAVTTDPNDLPFYEVADAGDADYLVTANVKHFSREDRVFLPKDFVEALRDEL